MSITPAISAGIRVTRVSCLTYRSKWHGMRVIWMTFIPAISAGMRIMSQLSLIPADVVVGIRGITVISFVLDSKFL